jgi:hypothetical protein
MRDCGVEALHAVVPLEYTESRLHDYRIKIAGLRGRSLGVVSFVRF